MATNNPNPNPSPNATIAPTASPASPPPPVITSLTDKTASKTKVSVETRYQTLVEGMLANFAHVTSFELSTGTYTLDGLVASLRTRIAAAEATKSAKTDWHNAVQTERQVDTEVRPLRKQLQQYVAARFGADSAKMAEFGFSPAKPRKPKAQTKANAASKAQATKKARGIIGSKQRKLIKAPPAATATPPAPVTAPATATPATNAPPSPTGSAK